MQVLSQSEIDNLLKNLLKDTSILPDSQPSAEKAAPQQSPVKENT